MSRLASDAKCGFYPASSVAIEGILRHLKLAENANDGAFIIDPCCGKGAAIKQIAESLSVAEGHVFGVELDRGRAEEAQSLLPNANILGPATFLGMQATGSSFGLAYVNPPFSDELGAHRREEHAFVVKATHLLVPRGILVLVCPTPTLIGNRSFIESIDANYDGIQVYKFPDEHRPFREIVLFGRKRRAELSREAIVNHGELHQRDWQWRTVGRIEDIPTLGDFQPKRWGPGGPSEERETVRRVWEVPRSSRPHTFKKTTYTEAELAECLRSSPLNSHFQDVTPAPLKRPPLPLDKGHLGLILASGMLDGVVDGPLESHVVRGSSTKVEYHNKELSISEENSENGAVSTKDVYSQRMVTIIRAASPNGTIYTFSNAPIDETKDDDSDDLDV